jgi:hypothetical protein
MIIEWRDIEFKIGEHTQRAVAADITFYHVRTEGDCVLAKVPHSTTEIELRCTGDAWVRFTAALRASERRALRRGRWNRRAKRARRARRPKERT